MINAVSAFPRPPPAYVRIARLAVSSSRASPDERWLPLVLLDDESGRVMPAASAPCIGGDFPIDGEPMLELADGLDALL